MGKYKRRESERVRQTDRDRERFLDLNVPSTVLGHLTMERETRR